MQLTFKLLFSVIDYCKSDDENEDFENFCKQFLPNDITVKKRRQRQQSPKLLAMALIPIVDGRDNLLEYLRKLIEDTISNNHINGKTFICFIFKVVQNRIHKGKQSLQKPSCNSTILRYANSLRL